MNAERGTRNAERKENLPFPGPRPPVLVPKRGDES